MPTKYEPLTDLDRSILDFEDQWWKYAGAKEQTVRDRFELTPTAYYRHLNQLLDHPDALAHAPLVVRRLTRLRDQRRHQRSTSRHAAS